MKFKIASEIFGRFTELNMGIVVARDIDNHGPSEEVMALIRERENLSVLSMDQKTARWLK